MNIVHVDRKSALIDINHEEVALIKEALPDIKTWLPVSSTGEYAALEGLMAGIEKLMVLMDDAERSSKP